VVEQCGGEILTSSVRLVSVCSLAEKNLSDVSVRVWSNNLGLSIVSTIIGMRTRKERECSRSNLPPPPSSPAKNEYGRILIAIHDLARAIVEDR
jgi:hypothetical protein